jgi:hypothetical protein
LKADAAAQHGFLPTCASKKRGEADEARKMVSTPVFSPTLVATPKPSLISLLAVGALGLMAAYRRKFLWQL